MIFTTHDTSLLNHLNRDEVWLTEKGENSATALTALAEYGGNKVKRSLNLEKAYLKEDLAQFLNLTSLPSARLLASVRQMARSNRKSRSSSLKCRVGVRKPRRTILLFCEGTRTEPEYLEALKRQLWVRDSAAVDLQVQNGLGGLVPTTLVSIAIQVRNKSIELDGEIDEFWCVFDVEWPNNHPALRDTVEQARQNGVELAISNPCFELWLVLHFQNQTGWLNNAEAQRLRHSLDGSQGKGLDTVRYMPLIMNAAQRAAKLDERHNGNDTEFPHNNPSSGMHRLISRLAPEEI